MNAERYIGFFYGKKEEAIEYLKKWIPKFENSPNCDSPKVKERILSMKKLLKDIEQL